MLGTATLLAALGFVGAGGGTLALYVTSAPSRLRIQTRRNGAQVRRASKKLAARIRAAENRVASEARPYAEARRRERLRQTPIQDLRKVGASHVRWSALENAA